MKALGEFVWMLVIVFFLTLLFWSITGAAEPPRVYLICADWCPPCQVQKKNMPAGSVILDYDSPEGRKLHTGNKIPQTIYIKDGKRWDKVGVFNVKEWIKSLGE